MNVDGSQEQQLTDNNADADALSPDTDGGGGCID
jgi:hypothetical protein